MHQNGSPDPLFETDEDRSWFSVVLRPHEAFEEADTPVEELETSETSQLLISILKKTLMPVTKTSTKTSTKTIPTSR